MEISGIQNKVAEFVRDNNLETAPEIRLLDLISEIGELNKEFLQGSDYGKNDLAAGREWALELGDVFFSLLCVANSTDVDMGEALQSVLSKYNKRIDERGEAGSAN
ncbi:MAG: MazG nucleotide pyrophosphohydrolase domain-containing protein [Bacillota bacterium]